MAVTAWGKSPDRRLSLFSLKVRGKPKNQPVNAMNQVVLNNLDHQHLRIHRGHGEHLGDNIRQVMIVPQEFREAQSCYPILFRKKAASDDIEPMALFGFYEQENLFLQGDRWDADYIPLAIQRLPFVIGYARDSFSSDQQPVICVDLDHPRVNQSQGEPVFLAQGGNSPYLDHINSILAELMRGVDQARALTRALQARGLLEPITLSATLRNGQAFELTGFLTIHEERLASLDAQSLDELHSAGHLACAYLALASLSRIRELIRRKEARSS